MDDSLTILVTGSNGLVGYQICEYLRKNTPWTLIGTSQSSGKHVHYQVDLSDSNQVQELRSSISPDLVIHAASISRTDICDKDKERCHAINVGSTENLIKAFPTSKFIYFSTYAVYNTEQGHCDEECPCSPLNYYIQTKIEGESFIKKTRDFVILRPSVIFGFVGYEQKSKNYFMQLIENIKQNKEMRSPKDQYINPIVVDQVVEAVYRIITRNGSGIFNLGSNEGISKFEFNLLLMKKFRFDTSLLTGIDSQTMEVKRPSIGTISSKKIQDTLHYTIIPLQEMIENLAVKDGMSIQKYLMQ